MQYVQWIFEHFFELVTAINGAIVALITLFMIIPGEQPEKFLRQAADFIGKFSKK